MKILFQARGATLQALFLVFLSIAVMVVDHRFQHLEVVRSNLSLVISPLRYLVSLPATAGNWLGDWFTSHTELLDENEALRDERRILSARLQKLEILAEENARLRNLLGSSRKIADDVIVAELLSVDQNPYRQLIEINKGSSDGVEMLEMRYRIRSNASDLIITPEASSGLQGWNADGFQVSSVGEETVVTRPMAEGQAHARLRIALKP